MQARNSFLHTIPGKFLHIIRNKSIRLSSIILLGNLLVWFIGLGLHIVSVRAETEQLRQTLQKAESERTLLLLFGLQETVLAGDWQSVHKELYYFEQYLTANSFVLSSPNGDILADGQKALPNAVVDIPLAVSEDPYGIQVFWEPYGTELTVTVPLLDRSNRVIAYLINHADRQETLAQIAASQWQSLLRLVIVCLLFSGFSLGLYWFFFTRLRRQFTRLAQAAARISTRVRAPQSTVEEVQELSTAFNLLAERMTEQKKAIETLKQQLNEEIAKSHHVLERSNSALLLRAQQLETLNAVISATASVLEIPALIRTILDQMLLIVNVPIGSICVREHVTLRGLEAQRSQQLRNIMRELRLESSEKVVVEDWQAAETVWGSNVTALMQQMEIRSSITIPILLHGKAAGHIGLADTQARCWLPEECALLEIIAHQIGITTERVQYFQDIQEHNRLMNLLVAQSEILNRPFTPQDVIEAIGQGVLALSKADFLAILTTKNVHQLSCQWSHPRTQTFLQSFLKDPDQSMSLAVLLTPALVTIDDITPLASNSPAWQQASAEGVRSFYAWPLVYEGQANVFVCCFYREGVIPDQHEQEVMEAFFRQAAAAMENTRLFAAECKQRQLAEALREVTAALASTLDLDEVLDGILEQLGRVIPHDAADITLIENGRVKFARSHGHLIEHEAEMFQWRYPVEQLRNLRVMSETGQAMVIPNTKDDPDWIVFSFSDWVHSYAGAPIAHHGEMFGFLNLTSRQPYFFDQDTISILTTFAHQAGICIANARLYRQTQRREADKNALFRAMKPLLNPNEDVIALARQITESVTQEFASAHCSVLLMDENNTRLTLVAQSGYSQPSVPQLALDGAGLTVTAVRTGDVIYASDVSQNECYVPGAPETRSELVIPLKGREKILGVLNLESHEINAFDENALDILTSFAERAALGLENALLFTAISNHAEQMLQLNNLTHTALQTMNSRAMLNELARQVAQMIQADGCYITLWDAVNEITIPTAAYGPNQEIYPTLVTAPGDLTLTASALRLNQTLVVEDIFDTPYLSPRKAPGYPVRSLLTLPLIVDNQKLGAVLVGFVESHRFTPEEITLGEQAAGQIALALTRLRSLEIAQRRAQEAETLREASMAMTASLDTQEVLVQILTHLEEVVPYDSACVFLVEPNHLRIGAVKNIPDAQGLKQQKFPVSDPLFIEIVTTKRPLILADAQSDARFHCWGGTHAVRGWMGVPLVSGTETLGILTLDRYSPNSFSTEEIELAFSFANHAALAVQNAKLHSAVQQLAITDPLTQVYNRRGFFELAHKILPGLQHTHQPISALMIDVDYFKHINDRYGHDAGDVVLQVITQRCRTILSERDLICRYGGEEFAVLLPESDLPGAQAVASQLFSAIVQSPIETDNGKVVVTISMGVATMGKASSTLEGLLKCADLALYQAKEKGRNRIFSWPA